MRKRFGQHFLVDQGAIRRIVELVQPASGQVAVEIGPGRGALTGALVERLGRLAAVEIDRDLAAALRQRFTPEQLHLVVGDVLQTDLAQLAAAVGGTSAFVVGNLPYNITAPLLFLLLEQAAHVDAAVVMVQREVARRLTAGPGTRDYSMVTVLLTMYGTVEVKLEVPHTAFRPVPKVDASVIELRLQAAPRVPVRDARWFERVVRTAFGQRRKMLRNSLADLVGAEHRSQLSELAASADVELTRRPETLSVEEFVRLSDQFAQADLARP